MNQTARTILNATLALVLSLLLCACGGQDTKPQPAPERDTSINFSGHWEMDYGRSDNLDDKLRSIYKELQRQAERRARQAGVDVSSRSAVVSGSPQLSNNMAAIIPLARLADFITTSQVIEIEQGEADIYVDREDTFALSCHFDSDEPSRVDDELGTELCGWDGHQLVFVVALPDGTRINHRLTLAPSGEQLHIATTVARSTQQAFTLNRVYYRFDPLPPDFECEYTLTRGNVCSRSKSS